MLAQPTLSQSSSPIPAPFSEDGSFLSIAEELVPIAPHKTAGQTALAFDGLLSPPLLLHEDLRASCGGQAWPAGLMLAEYLLRRPQIWQDRRILELGAGGGLVGLALARFLQQRAPSLRNRVQGHVLPQPEADQVLPQPEVIDQAEARGKHHWPASGQRSASPRINQQPAQLGPSDELSLARQDDQQIKVDAHGRLSSPILITDLPELLPLQQKNIALNDLAPSLIQSTALAWGRPLTEQIPVCYHRPDLILAADCVYFEPAFPLLLQTLDELLGSDRPDTATTPHGVCYFCMKKRRKADMRFLAILKKRFAVTQIEAPLPDGEKGIYLFEVRKRKN